MIKIKDYIHPEHSYQGFFSMVRFIIQHYLKIWKIEITDNISKTLFLAFGIIMQLAVWLLAWVTTDFMPLAAIFAIGASVCTIAEFRIPQHLTPLDPQHIVALPCSMGLKWTALIIAEAQLYILILFFILGLQLYFCNSTNWLTVANILLFWAFYIFISVFGLVVWTRNKKLSNITIIAQLVGFTPILLCVNHHENTTRGAILCKLNSLYLDHELSVFIGLLVIAVASAIVSAKAFQHICTTYPFRKPELLQRLKRKG